MDGYEGLGTGYNNITLAVVEGVLERVVSDERLRTALLETFLDPKYMGRYDVEKMIEEMVREFYEKFMRDPAEDIVLKGGKLEYALSLSGDVSAFDAHIWSGVGYISEEKGIFAKVWSKFKRWLRGYADEGKYD